MNEKKKTKKSEKRVGNNSRELYWIGWFEKKNITTIYNTVCFITTIAGIQCIISVTFTIYYNK